MPASGVKSSALLQPELGKPAYLGRAAIDMAIGGAGRARAGARAESPRLHPVTPREKPRLVAVTKKQASRKVSLQTTPQADAARISVGH
jgi:hypothetical protein